MADEAAVRRGWPAFVIGESDLNDPRVLYSGRSRRLWAGRPMGGRLPPCGARLPHRRAGTATTSTSARPSNWPGCSKQPFLYAWDYSPFRGRKHGAPPEGLSGDRFVVCLQNHDQVGNRARGDRLDALLDSPAQQRLAAGLLLLSPYLPLLFMGEEYGEENPFPFFCSFGDPQLVQAVREGRKKEFDAFAWQGEVPDPQGEETFASARLSWSWPEGTQRAGLRRLYRDLLSARREWPALRDFERRSARLLPDAKHGPVLELVRGDDLAGAAIRAFFNLGDRPLPSQRTLPPGRRSCSIPKPRTTAAAAARPRSHRSEFGPHPGVIRMLSEGPACPGRRLPG